MSLDPVTAIGDAVSKVFGTAKPFVEDAIKQKYEKQHKDRVKKFNEIMSEEDSDSRRNKLQSITDELLGDAGATLLGVESTSIELPVGRFASLFSECSEKVMHDKLIANMRFKEN